MRVLSLGSVPWPYLKDPVIPQTGFRASSSVSIASQLGSGVSNHLITSVSSTVE